MTAPTVAAASVPVTISGTTPVPVTDGHNAPVGMTLLNRGDNGGTVLVQPGPAGQAAAVPLGPAGSLTWTDPANVPYVSLRVPGAAPETVLLTSQSAAYSNPTVVAAATAASLAASGIPQLFTSTAVYAATLQPGASSPTLNVSNYASLNLFTSFVLPATIPPLLSTTFDGVSDGAPWPVAVSVGYLGSPAPTVDVLGGQGRIITNGQSGGNRTQVVLTGAATGSSNDFELLLDLTNMSSFTAVSDYFAIWLNAFGLSAAPAATSTPSGLLVKINPQSNPSVVVGYCSTGSTTVNTIVSAASPVTFVGPGVPVRLRIRRDTVAGTIAVRIWPPSTTEPTAWTIGPTAVPSNGNTNAFGQVMLEEYIGNTSDHPVWYVDNLSITPNAHLYPGAVQAKFTDPALTTPPTGGPWLALDPNWSTTETCFVASPVIAPQLVLVNTGGSAAQVAVAGTTRTASTVRQIGDDTGVRQLSAAGIATNTTVQLTSTAGSSLTRFNGHCQLIVTGMSSGALVAYYINEGGATVSQTVTSANGTFDYMHPSVPVRWAYINGSASTGITVTLTVAAAS